MIRNRLKKKKYRDLPELKGLLREKNVSYEKLAKYLDLSISAVSDKINGISTFSLLEAYKIIDLLEIQPDRIANYFFWLRICETQKRREHARTI